MVVRASWAVDDAINVLDARLAMGAVWTPAGATTSRTGMLPVAGTLAPGVVTATSPTPNGQVRVAPFRGVYQSGRSGGGGTYTWCLDAPYTVDVLGTAPAHPSNPRIDLVVFQQSDTYHSDTDSLLRIRLVSGTPAPSPVPPVVSGSPDYVVRAHILIPAGATAITDSTITNLAMPRVVAAGGILPVYSQTERDAISNPYDGQAIYRYDREWVEIFDSGSWRVQGIARCSTISDRDAVITYPVSGQFAATSSPDVLWQYSSGQWRAYTPAAVDAHYRANQLQTLSANVVTPLWFDTTTTTTSAVTASGTSGHTTTFTLNQAGCWMIVCATRFNGVPGGGERSLEIVNTSDGSSVTAIADYPGTGNPWNATVSALIRVNPGHAIHVIAYQQSGSTLTLDQARTRLDLTWIGP